MILLYVCRDMKHGGKFGEHERGLRVRPAESNSRFFRSLQTSQVLDTSTYAQLNHEPFVLWHFLTRSMRQLPAQSSTRQYLRDNFFLTHSYVSSVIFKLHEKTFTELSLETTFKKFLESILRWKTTNLPQNSFWTKTKTLERIICTRHSSQLTTTFTSTSSPLLSINEFKSVSL